MYPVDNLRWQMSALRQFNVELIWTDVRLTSADVACLLVTVLNVKRMIVRLIQPKIIVCTCLLLHRNKPIYGIGHSSLGHDPSKTSCCKSISRRTCFLVNLLSWCLGVVQLMPPTKNQTLLFLTQILWALMARKIPPIYFLVPNLIFFCVCVCWGGGGGGVLSVQAVPEQNGGIRFFTPLDHLLICINPMWPPKVYKVSYHH